MTTFGKTTAAMPSAPPIEGVLREVNPEAVFDVLRIVHCDADSVLVRHVLKHLIQCGCINYAIQPGLGLQPVSGFNPVLYRLWQIAKTADQQAL
jgi:hypothetical protein